MKFVTYKLPKHNENRFGFISNNKITDVQNAASFLNKSTNKSIYSDIPNSLKDSLTNWDSNFEKLRTLKLKR